MLKSADVQGSVVARVEGVGQYSLISTTRTAMHGQYRESVCSLETKFSSTGRSNAWGDALRFGQALVTH